LKFEEFEQQLAVSAFVVGAAALMKAGGISLLFALALFGLSQVGFFALAALKKSGMNSPSAEYSFALAVFACYFIASFAFSGLSLAVPYLFLPLIFSTPAVVGTVKTFLG
jgi:hypothetical protein